MRTYSLIWSDQRTGRDIVLRSVLLLRYLVMYEVLFYAAV